MLAAADVGCQGSQHRFEGFFSPLFQNTFWYLITYDEEATSRVHLPSNSECSTIVSAN